MQWFWTEIWTWDTFWHPDVPRYSHYFGVTYDFPYLELTLVDLNF